MGRCDEMALRRDKGWAMVPECAQSEKSLWWNELCGSRTKGEAMRL